MLLNPDSLETITEQLRTALERDDITAAAAEASKLSSARVAGVLAEHPADMVARCLESLEPEKAGRVIGHLPPALGSELLVGPDSEKLAKLFGLVPLDKAVAIYRAIEAEARESLLQRLDGRRRDELLSLASHPPGSAGSVMTPRFITIEESRTVGEALQALLAASEQAERPVYVYAVNGSGALTGVVSLRDLLRFEKSTPVSRAMNTHVVAADVDDSAADAARLLHDRRFMMIPVVTGDRRVAGVLTFDDAMDILTETAVDQVAAAGGTLEESFLTGPRQAVRHRLPWMAMNVFLNLGAVTVITGFEATIAQVAILAAFLPMITDMGGNVGIQSLSVAIRSIALGEARTRDFARAARKEVVIGVVNGLALGGLFAAIALLWRGDLWLGGLAGIALGANVLVAGVVGGCLPFAIKKLGKDPAMMTGPFLTTITDITGVSIYLGLSTIFLARLAG